MSPATSPRQADARPPDGAVARGGRFSFDDVASNRADLGIEQPSVAKSSVETRQLARSRMLCVLPPSHELRGRGPIDASALSGRPVIHYPAKTINGGRLQNLLRDLAIEYEPVFQTDSALLACRMAMELGAPAIIDSMMDVAGLFPALQCAEFRPSLEFELHAF